MDWKEENNFLIKDFKFADFSEAIQFVNKVAIYAEEMNHHPEIFLHNYNKVQIKITTHSEKKITEKDYQLAEKVDSI